MGFDAADYQRAAKLLDVPVPHIQAMAAVESSGETFWVLDDKLVVPVRFEAHWFGKLTGYRFNTSHPELSSVEWKAALASRTRAGAWDQVRRAEALDRSAARQATSWGGFQVMGFHWKSLGYPSVDALVDSMSANGDDGQMDAFARFVDRNERLQFALKIGDWDTVELLYNGGGYAGAYAAKLRDAVALYADPRNAMPAPRLLRKGDHGADVARLRRALGLASNDNFDADADAAVRRFQASHGLAVDGLVGLMTLRSLGLAA